jgi:HD-GYP domain-containing protein (c-di-GMP phosphodiesterase class II)
MNIVDISSLTPGTVARANFYSDKGELLISKGTLITSHHLVILKARSNQSLFVKSTSEEDELNSLLSKELTELDELDFLEGKAAKSSVVLNNLEKEIDELIDIKKISSGKAGFIELSRSKIALALDEKPIVDSPEGPPLNLSITQIAAEDRTQIYKDEIFLCYEEALVETERILKLLAANSNVLAEDLARIVRRFLKIFISDRNILLNIANTKSAEGDYLFNHSLNVCLLSINVAASYGYSETQVLEIGMGALVHDIGMLLVPEELRHKPGRLSEDDWFEIQKHPIMGLHLLEKIRNMPEHIPYIAYQVHERENGTGYPKKRSGNLVHRYAKMVQVADVFEALSSPRSHRKAFTPCESMTKLLMMAKQGLLSRNAVKAFIDYVSLFPVGSLVELNSHAIAKIVQCNKMALSRPVVSILTDAKGIRLQHGQTQYLDLSKSPAVSIARSLPTQHFDKLNVMDGF